MSIVSSPRLSRGYFFLVLIVLVNLGARQAPAQRSPFTDVEFDIAVTVNVVYNGRRYELLEIDGVPVDRLVAYSRERYGDKWSKRIAEDLVEVLAGLDHEVGETIPLKLGDPQSGKVIEVNNAQVTKANRARVRESRDTRQSLSSLPDFEKTLRTKWAYYDFRKPAIEEQIASLRRSTADGVERGGLRLEMQKVIARGVDGHASVRGWTLAGARLPFLIEPIGGQYVAFLPDRSRLLDPERPYLTAIEGRPIDLWVKAAAAVEPEGSPQFVRRQALRHLRAIEHWRRELGDPRPTAPVRVTLADREANSPNEISLPTAKRTPVYGKWPRGHSRVIQGDLGYLRITKMDRSAVASIREWMPRFRETKGLIVDVRGNGGGRRDALRLLSAYLLSPGDGPVVVNAAKRLLHPDFDEDHLESRYLYPLNSRRFSQADRRAIEAFRKRFQPAWEVPDGRFSDWHYMVLNRDADLDAFHYDKPVVVLMDAKCFSATDIFLAGMKELPRVTLIGEPSGGGSARSVTTRLPGGIEVRLASMASFQPNGRLFDGAGVSPDIVVEPVPEYFVGGRDLALEKAIAIARNEEQP